MFMRSSKRSSGQEIGDQEPVEWSDYDSWGWDIKETRSWKRR